MSLVTTKPQNLPLELMRKHGGLRMLLCCRSAPSNSASFFFSSRFFVFNPEGNECIAAKAEYCGKCIQVGAECGWCKDPVCEGKTMAF